MDEGCVWVGAGTIRAGLGSSGALIIAFSSEYLSFTLDSIIRHVSKIHCVWSIVTFMHSNIHSFIDSFCFENWTLAIHFALGIEHPLWLEYWALVAHWSFHHSCSLLLPWFQVDSDEGPIPVKSSVLLPHEVSAAIHEAAPDQASLWSQNNKHFVWTTCFDEIGQPCQFRSIMCGNNRADSILNFWNHIKTLPTYQHHSLLHSLSDAELAKAIPFSLHGDGCEFFSRSFLHWVGVHLSHQEVWLRMCWQTSFLFWLQLSHTWLYKQQLEQTLFFW